MLLAFIGLPNGFFLYLCFLFSDYGFVNLLVFCLIYNAWKR